MLIIDRQQVELGTGRWPDALYDTSGAKKQKKVLSMYDIVYVSRTRLTMLREA